jgi:hypothetical protein
LGYSHPVWPWYSQNTLPFRYSIICPRSKTRLLEHSSREVRPSFAVLYSKSPSSASQLRTTLMGFVSPSACTDSKNPRSSDFAEVLPCRSPKALPGFHQQVPPCQIRYRSQVFSTSQRSFSPCRHPTIFRPVTLMGLHPSGIFSSNEASNNSSLSEYPLDVIPSGCAVPVLG